MTVNKVNKSFRKCDKVKKRFGMTVTKIHEENEKRFNPGNVYYHSIQTLISSHWLSRKIKIKIHSLFCVSVKFDVLNWESTCNENICEQDDENIWN